MAAHKAHKAAICCRPLIRPTDSQLVSSYLAERNQTNGRAEQNKGLNWTLKPIFEMRDTRPDNASSIDDDDDNYDDGQVVGIDQIQSNSARRTDDG